MEGEAYFLGRVGSTSESCCQELVRSDGKKRSAREVRAHALDGGV